jgi:hypothetical protein
MSLAGAAGMPAQCWSKQPILVANAFFLPRHLGRADQPGGKRSRRMLLQRRQGARHDQTILLVHDGRRVPTEHSTSGSTRRSSTPPSCIYWGGLAARIWR